MTNEDVIRILIECKGCKYLDEENACAEESGECFRAKRIAIALIRKHIPKRPKDIGSYSECDCGQLLKWDGDDVRDGYCPKCGQRLE